MPIFEIGKKMFCIAFCFELCIFSIKWLLIVGEISRWIRQTDPSTDPSDDESDCQRFLECLDGKKGNGRRGFFYYNGAWRWSSRKLSYRSRRPLTDFYTTV